LLTNWLCLNLINFTTSSFLYVRSLHNGTILKNTIISTNFPYCFAQKTTSTQRSSITSQNAHFHNLLSSSWSFASTHTGTKPPSYFNFFRFVLSRIITLEQFHLFDKENRGRKIVIQSILPEFPNRKKGVLDICTSSTYTS